MEYNPSQTIACIDSTKDACLYFDNVIPLNLGHIIPWKGNGEPEAHEILHQVLPKELLNQSQPLGLSPYVLSYIDAYVNVFPIAIGVPQGSKEEMDKRARHFFPILIQRQNDLFESLSESIDAVFGASTSQFETSVQEPAFILTNLKLIDTSELSWHHLLEIKRDKESLSKLRRLRTFIYQNYENQPLSFIEDDLLNRIESYETSAKHLGLRTTDSAFKIAFNSGSLFASAAATIFSAYSGTPTTIPLSLAIGSAFMLGNIGLELRSLKRETYKFKQDDPITYIVENKNRIS